MAHVHFYICESVLKLRKLYFVTALNIAFSNTKDVSETKSNVNLRERGDTPKTVKLKGLRECTGALGQGRRRQGKTSGYIMEPQEV